MSSLRVLVADLPLGLPLRITLSDRLHLVRTASSLPLTAFPLAELRTGRFSTGAYVVDTLSWRSPYTSVTLTGAEENDADEAVYAGCVLLSGEGWCPCP